MSANIAQNTWKSRPFAVLTVAAILMAAATAPAAGQTAGDILTKTTADHRVGYISGVVEGLAFARYLRDKPDTSGMKCIYDWYLKGGDAVWTKILAWLQRHPDKRVGVLVHVLVKRECGD